jgi:hypothetical protein
MNKKSRLNLERKSLAQSTGRDTLKLVKFERRQLQYQFVGFAKSGAKNSVWFVAFTNLLANAKKMMFGTWIIPLPKLANITYMKCGAYMSYFFI